MPILLAALLGLGILAGAWSAGFFWTWSFTVMPGLGAAGAEAAIAAMRATNAGIQTAGFAFVFFGPFVFAALAAVVAWVVGRRGAALASGAAALIYGVGVLAVTFLFNLPLNDALAVADPARDGAAAVWARYAGPWTAWNHLRTAAATGALGALLAAAWRSASSRPARA